MEASSATGPPVISKRKQWSGRIVSAIPVFMLLTSALMKLLRPPAALEGMAHLGYAESLLLPLAMVEIGVTVIYIWPRTAVLGAILVTAYLGGATATHVRVGDPWLAPVVLGVLVWVGLYLREERLGALLPWRRQG